MGHGTMAGHGLFLGAAAFGVALTLITEGLSLWHQLTPGWLAASWALACGIGVWARRGRRPRGPAARRGRSLEGRGGRSERSSR